MLESAQLFGLYLDNPGQMQTAPPDGFSCTVRQVAGHELTILNHQATGIRTGMMIPEEPFTLGAISDTHLLLGVSSLGGLAEVLKYRFKITGGDIFDGLDGLTRWLITKRFKERFAETFPPADTLHLLGGHDKGLLEELQPEAVIVDQLLIAIAGKCILLTHGDTFAKALENIYGRRHEKELLIKLRGLLERAAKHVPGSPLLNVPLYLLDPAKLASWLFHDDPFNRRMASAVRSLVTRQDVDIPLAGVFYGHSHVAYEEKIQGSGGPVYIASIGDSRTGPFGSRLRTERVLEVAVNPGEEAFQAKRIVHRPVRKLRGQDPLIRSIT